MFKKLQDRIKNLSLNNLNSVVIYTFFWIFLAGLILFIFQKNGKTFLWMTDGAYQHFISFNYLCDYLGDLIHNLHFSGFFNFTLGQGMDVLTTLNSYDFTDPISILCAFVFPLSRVGRYTLMIFIKLYLIGISFIFYCNVTERKGNLAIIAGALAYVFCGAVLFMVARHPNYINWAYFFPFLLGGVELYFRKGEKLPLILFVFLNLITSYYTFYMNAILMVIYVLVHVVCRVVKDRKLSVLQEEFIQCLKVAGVCCIGILLSAFILFPTIYAFLNNNRIAELTGYTESAWLYEDEFYKNSFENIFVPLKGQYTSVIGFNTVLIIPLALIFTKKRQYTEIKTLFLISLLMMGIPIIGRIMNGFGYASNRWAYVIPFYASVILVIMFTEIGNMSGKEKSFVYLVVTVYVTLCYLHTQTNDDSQKLATLIMLIAVALVISIALRYKYPAFEPLLFSIVILGACFQIYFAFSEFEGNYVSDFMDETDIEISYKDYSSTAVSNLNDTNEFYRTEMKERRTNVNGVNKVNGTGYWWSMISGDMMDYYTRLALDDVVSNCSSDGLDGRSGLLELASVKYYTRPTESEGLIPYGYEEIPSKNAKYQIFENKYSLPIGYTYTNYISKSEYEKMNGIEREQALLQSATVEEDIPGLLKNTNIEHDYQVLDYEMINIEGATYTGNSIKTIDKENSIELQATIPDDCDYEIYLYITSIDLADSVVIDEDTMFDNISRIQLDVTRTKNDCTIHKFAKISNLNYNWPSLQNDILFNLGVGYAGENTITLSFDRIAELSFDDIQIIAVPMSTYEKYAEQLGEYVLEDVSVGEDKINGTITVPEERILQFSVPYSDGWKAYVDGEEVSIMKSDVMYMAIPISAGSHDIELRYETPYLRIGIIVSIATAIIYAAYEIIRHTSKKHRGVQENG